MKTKEAPPKVVRIRCKICNRKFVPARKNAVTCSPECSTAWRNSNARYQASEEHREMHRISRARTIWHNRKNYPKNQVDHAKRVLQEVGELK